MRSKILLIFFIFSTLLFAQDKRKVGLIPFHNATKNTKYDWVSYGFEYYLYGKLSVVSGFYIPEKESFHKSLQETGYNGGPIEDRMIYHIGKQSGVEVTISGSYKVSGSRFELTVRYSNAFNGTELMSSTFNEPLSNFFTVGRQITDQLITLAGISVKQMELRLLDFTFTKSIRAYESFIRAYMENEKDNARIEVVTGLFRKAIREDANFWEAYYNLGIVYFNSGSYDRALDQFNRVITALPNFDKPYLGRGLIYEKQKKYKLAIEDFTKVTQFNPNDYKPFYYLGKISILDKEYTEADEYLNKSLQLNPDYAPTFFQLGNIFYAQDSYRRSINYYKKAVKLDDKNADYHLKLGDTFYRSQIYYNALMEIDAAIAIEPNNPIAYFLKGITIYKQAVLEELVNAFLDMLSENPKEPQKEKTKAGRFKKQAAIDPVTKKQVYMDMADAFSNAVRLRSNFMEAGFNLALTYHEMGNFAEAERYYLKTIQNNPGLVRSHMKLAQLYTETDRKEQAIVQYRHIFTIAPLIFVNNPTLGPEHQYVNILNKFKREVEVKLQQNPNNPGNNLILAKLLKAQGQYGKAANLARKVLSVNPNNSEAKALLEKIQN